MKVPKSLFDPPHGYECKMVDYAGNKIYHESRLRHPDGTEFVAINTIIGESLITFSNSWRAVYDGEDISTSSWLGNQIGDKGKAVVINPRNTPSSASAADQSPV
jgi:hypothetical protein